MITSRAYSDKADLERLIRFLVAERKRDPVQRWHVGDLIWRMFYSSDFDPAQNVRLWEEDGEVVGFGWLYPPSGADLNPRAGWRRCWWRQALKIWCHRRFIKRSVSKSSAAS